MLFNSLGYLIFLPLVVLVYFSIPHRWRWLWLLAASYYFYMSWKPIYGILLFATTLLDYAVAIMLGRTETPSSRWLLLLVSLVTNLGMLFFFKYYNFAAESAARLLGWFALPSPLPYLDVVLPIGISFYVLQSLGYTIDVFRRRLAPEPHLGIFMLYGFNEGTGLHLRMLKYQPSMLKALNTPTQWLTLLKEYPTFLRTMRTIALNTNFREFYPVTPGDSETTYRRNGFNEYGDLVSHFNLPAPLWNPVNAVEAQRQFEGDGLKPTPDSPGYFNDYHAFVKERGASIYFMWTPQRLASMPSLDALAYMEKDTLGITISPIGVPANYDFPDDYFFDTPPHLHKVGRTARTDQLIEDLLQLISQSLPED